MEAPGLSHAFQGMLASARQAPVSQPQPQSQGQLRSRFQPSQAAEVHYLAAGKLQDNKTKKKKLQWWIPLCVVLFIGLLVAILFLILKKPKKPTPPTPSSTTDSNQVDPREDTRAAVELQPTRQDTFQRYVQEHTEFAIRNGMNTQDAAAWAVRTVTEKLELLQKGQDRPQPTQTPQPAPAPVQAPQPAPPSAQTPQPAPYQPEPLPTSDPIPNAEDVFLRRKPRPAVEPDLPPLNLPQQPRPQPQPQQPRPQPRPLQPPAQPLPKVTTKGTVALGKDGKTFQAVDGPVGGFVPLPR